MKESCFTLFGLFFLSQLNILLNALGTDLQQQTG